jgi:DNA-binding MarR family transcriptional regulator
MQRVLMELIDTVNTRHSKGVDFGTGHNLFPAEIHTIATIGINEGITITQLAEHLKVSKPTISERVRKLVEKGLIVKKKKVEDAKSVALGLTIRGKIAFAGHEAHHLKMYERFREYLGSETQSKIESFSQTFTQFLSIVRNLDNKGH